MKSAYELALERMEAQGIDRPREDALSEETRAAIAEARRRAEAKIAEREIMHRERVKSILDPIARQQEEEGFQRERQRITEKCDKEVERLRTG
jgi:hypothetical protein